MINIIIHRSAGNESVGSMWHESYEIDENITVKEMIKIVRNEQNSCEDIIIPVFKAGVK